MRLSLALLLAAFQVTPLFAEELILIGSNHHPWGDENQFWLHMSHHAKAGQFIYAIESHPFSGVKPSQVAYGIESYEAMALASAIIATNALTYEAVVSIEISAEIFRYAFGKGIQDLWGNPVMREAAKKVSQSEEIDPRIKEIIGKLESGAIDSFEALKSHVMGHLRFSQHATVT